MWLQGPFMPCHHLGPEIFLFVEVTKLPARHPLKIAKQIMVFYPSW